METKDSHSFPILHDLMQMARPVITSRHWIVIILILVIFLYLPILFSGFYLDDFYFLSRFSPDVYQQIHERYQAEFRNPINLSNFEYDSTLQYIRDMGFTPWWASDHITVNFFRPFSSLTLAFDYNLWPDTPLFFHVHSLLWFCLFILLAYQYYQSISGNALVAGISILFLALDDVFIYPAGWISNRHALIAMVFCLLTMQMYHLGTSKKKWFYFAAAAGTYSLALLASEMGVVALLYLFANLFTLDRDKWIGRIWRITPFVLITLIWRVAYNIMSFGVKGSLLYVDPIFSPIEFMSQMLGRYPTYLFSTAGPPLARILVAASPQSTVVIAAVSFIFLSLLVLIVYPVLKARQTSAFWVLGLCLAAVPLTTGVPGDRNLGLVSLGVMGLMGQLLVDLADRKRTEHLKKYYVVSLKISIPILLAIHLILPLTSILTWTEEMQARREKIGRLVDFGDNPVLEEQHLFIINPPGTSFYSSGIAQRLFEGTPLPASLVYLSSGYVPVHIERVDLHTLIITPLGGYSPRPGPIIDNMSGKVSHISEENVSRMIDGILYNPDNPMRVGQIVSLSEVTIKATRMTSEGQIAQASFAFEKQLEDDRYLWLLWHENTLTYVKVLMPAVGESRIYYRNLGYYWQR